MNAGRILDGCLRMTKSLLRMMHRTLRPGGTLLLFSHSLAWETTRNLAEKLIAEGLLEPAGEWQSLRLDTAREPAGSLSPGRTLHR